MQGGFHYTLCELNDLLVELEMVLFAAYLCIGFCQVRKPTVFNLVLDLFYLSGALFDLLARLVILASSSLSSAYVTLRNLTVLKSPFDVLYCAFDHDAYNP